VGGEIEVETDPILDPMAYLPPGRLTHAPLIKQSVRAR
ncbi:MAG: hypothetical protein ACI8QC_001990, partial [Planctomycetota bacterium]